MKNYTKEETIQLCREYMPEDKVNLIIKAAKFSERAHRDQRRKSGEPYFIHPTQVAAILAELKMDPDTVATGFLHDVVEDTGISLDDIEYFFSKTIATLVDGVTKLGKVKYRSKEQQQVENHQKMLLAMANDLRVIMVKLADRLHNMRTLKWHRLEKKIQISRETLEIYAPLADRLGMNQIKWELEDTCLRYMNPEAYYSIVHLMNAKRNEREKYIEHFIEKLKKQLKDSIEEGYEIYGRPKHIYSIYRKMKEQEKPFSEIYDLLAIRVIVHTLKDCYTVLGISHTTWKPLPGRFKDYIAMPKANMYQSLHTTVMGDKGSPVEIQIRTFEMHEVAEYGVAAHWAYKKGVKEKVKQDTLDAQIAWFKEIQDLSHDSSDAKNFVNAVKEDIFKDKVYVFTPQGDVQELPKGAGPLDFAYQIHTEVGNQTVGAKVNNKIVPLDHSLKNGDIVEILTSKNSVGPSRDWIKFVQTNRARNKIKRFFKLEDREQAIHDGCQALEHKLSKEDYVLKDVLTKDLQVQLEDRFNFHSMEDLYAAIGFNELSTTAVANRIMEAADLLKKDEQEENLEKALASKKEQAKPAMLVKHKDGVLVEGADNMLFRLAHCCTPVPGDDIIGYITKGRGISVHRKDCHNITKNKNMQERLIKVEWDEDHSEDVVYDVELTITGYERNGLLNEIIQVLSPLTKTISNINGNIDPQTHTAKIIVRIGILNVQDLTLIKDKIKSIPDVYTVERTMN